MLDLFVGHGRHFNTALTLISQTVEEFITGDISKGIYDQCDVTQVFTLTDISEPVVEYLNLTPTEGSFITGATRGRTAPTRKVRCR